MSNFEDSFSIFGNDNQLYNIYHDNSNKGNNSLNHITANFNFNTFQNNSVLDFQNNFNLFGGNQNQNCTMNNIKNLNNKTFNNINNNIALPFNNCNINECEKEITINFRFINCLNFKVKAKLNEKLIDVINRFKNNECPQEFKNVPNVIACHGEAIQDLKKTLLELNIKDKENILFLKSHYEPNEYIDKEEEYKLTQREKEQIEILKSQYKEKYIDKGLNNKLKLSKHNIDNNIDYEEYINVEIPSFFNFMEKRDLMRRGINVKEHGHLLVYCLTNLDWTCNMCNNIYSKEDMKYYCSLCDYSMCQNCHYKRKYLMKKSFPKGIKPSNPSVNMHFFQTDYHEHRLVFCRPSKYFTSFRSWKCKNCCDIFRNKIWCFYCTLCNYNLCCNCCGFH